MHIEKRQREIQLDEKIKLMKNVGKNVGKRKTQQRDEVKIKDN